MSGFLSAIRDELPNKEFRESYVAENVRRGVAYQIRALREARGWSPAEFSRQADKPQSNISRWENPNYGKFNLSTLIEIASLFDVGLSVRFVGFDDLLTSLSDLRPQTLAVPSYAQEQENQAARIAEGVAEPTGALAAFYREPTQRVPSKSVDQSPRSQDILAPHAAEDSGKLVRPWVAVRLSAQERQVSL